LEVEEREEVRRKKGLAPRIIILPWSYEEEEKLIAAKRKPERNAKPSREVVPRNLPGREKRPHEHAIVSGNIRTESGV
jgi:hypothetical protein